ncbi:hypothetical protein B296_00041476 [Ensete ventricosum]|uniref:Retrotransposon gag domain-containing protein n=1 Tax=Ensete ventricosum TaxID=4639 RepID=A0A426ZLQ2_ENSVE|nr:hypothetical protein B296_00041476 [Ensete ventricosum]
MPLIPQQKKNRNITDLESYAMASEELIDAKLEAFEMRMKDKLYALFAEFSLGWPSSPRRSQQGESLDHKEDSQEKGESTTDPSYPRIRVDFPRWEGDPIGWISRAKCYFRYHKTPNASMVDIVAIHLEGDTIQWYDWFKHTHKVPTWRLLMIEPVEESEHKEEDLEHEEDTEEEPQPVDCMMHALAAYTNLHTMKVGVLKRQPITILIDTESTNNFMNNKVIARMTLDIKDCSRFDVKVADDRILKCDRRCPHV